MRQLHTIYQCRLMICVVTLLASMSLHPTIGQAASGDRLDRSRFVLTFSEDFQKELSLYDKQTNPAGRWKTNYDFGWQQGASSRTLNDEAEVYVDRNYNSVNPFTISGHALTITAERNREPKDPKTGGKPFTSGLLTTSTSFSQLYGYFEMRAKLPADPGAWPAFWLVTHLNPAITTPQHGYEIDVMELLGNDPRQIYCSLHWPNKTGGASAQSFPVSVANTGMPHTYGVLWSKNSIVWYVNDVEVARKDNFYMQRPMYILTNLALGGWNNNRPSASLTKTQFEVDFIHAYTVK